MSRQRKVTVIEPQQQGVHGGDPSAVRKMRVAAYARVSTDKEEQQSSYEAQIDYYTHYVQSKPDWELVAIFSDEGISGTNTKKRDGFNKMVEKALNGEIDLILTKSISRFARNTVDTLQTVRKLKAAGVEVIFEKENLHTLDPKCEVMLTIMSSLAQEESRSISENIRWGVQKSMRDGKVSLAYSRFLGYRKGEDGRLEIVEEEAKIVREIYEMFLAGETIRQIAAYLTGKGIPTPAGKNQWPVSTIRSILSNEKYKGDALLQKTYTVDYLTKEVAKNDGSKTQYLVENSHDAIIDPEIFERVQKKLKKSSIDSKRIRGGNPFSSRLICAECGTFYGRKVWHNNANTERYSVWCCNHRYSGKERCMAPVIQEDKLREAYLFALTEKYGVEVASNEKQWRRWVECVTIYPNGEMSFLFEDDTKATVFCDIFK